MRDPIRQAILRVRNAVTNSRPWRLLVLLISPFFMTLSTVVDADGTKKENVFAKVAGLTSPPVVGGWAVTTAAWLLIETLKDASLFSVISSPEGYEVAKHAVFVAKAVVAVSALPIIYAFSLAAYAHHSVARLAVRACGGSAPRVPLYYWTTTMGVGAVWLALGITVTSIFIPALVKGGPSPIVDAIWAHQWVVVPIGVLGGTLGNIRERVRRRGYAELYGSGVAHFFVTIADVIALFGILYLVGILPLR